MAGAYPDDAIVVITGQSHIIDASAIQSQLDRDGGTRSAQSWELFAFNSSQCEDSAFIGEGPRIFLRFQPSANTSIGYIVSTCSDPWAFDTDLAVFVEESRGGVQQACNGDGRLGSLPHQSGCQPGYSSLRFFADAGQPYIIAISSHNGALRGNITIKVSLDALSPAPPPAAPTSPVPPTPPPPMVATFTALKEAVERAQPGQPTLLVEVPGQFEAMLGTIRVPMSSSVAIRGLDPSRKTILAGHGTFQLFVVEEEAQLYLANLQLTGGGALGSQVSVYRQPAMSVREPQLIQRIPCSSMLCRAAAEVLSS